MTIPFKSIFVFVAISIAFDVIKRSIFVRFDLAKLFTPDFFLFEVGVESVVVFLAALGLSILSSRIKNHALGTTLFKALIFGVLYGLLAFVFNYFVLAWMVSTSNLPLDIFNTFLKFIPAGFMQGVLFLLVSSHFLPKTTNPKD